MRPSHLRKATADHNAGFLKPGGAIAALAISLFGAAIRIGHRDAWTNLSSPAEGIRITCQARQPDTVPVGGLRHFQQDR